MKIIGLNVDKISVLSADELKYITLKEIDSYFKKNKQGHLGVIYSYTSLNSGKMYIGQTIAPFSRNGTHISSSKPNSKRKDAKCPIYKAFREEGFENFRYNVLKVSHSYDLKEFKEMQDFHEQHFISLYQTTEKSKGFNVNAGGVSLPLGSTSYWARSVKQYSRSGKFIREYESINDAVRETNVSGSGISSVCSSNSPRKVAGGYLWTYSENDLDHLFIKHATRGIIHRYTIEGQYINTFDSYISASTVVNGDSSRIKLCAEPPCVHIAYGYRWSKEKVTQILESPVKLSVEVHKYDKEGQYVASYDTQAEGAMSIGVSSTAHLGVCLKDLWRRAGGFYWRLFKIDKIDIPSKLVRYYGK